QALVRLHRDHLDLEAVQATLGCLLKDRDDLSALAATETAALVAAAQGTEAPAS
ncbi:MAG: MoxR family ATPase, partial [Gemmatimonadetes bacterium]|nr:MoxR family ATPase [Gemmatimonadota bacterium]